MLGVGLERLFVSYEVDFSAQEFFDSPEKLVLLLANKRDGLAIFASSAGASDTVHIVLGDIGELVVNYKGKVLDIQSTSCDIGRH